MGGVQLVGRVKKGKPKFLQRLDHLSRRLAQNQAEAEYAKDDLRTMNGLADLLAKGEKYKLITPPADDASEEHNHFLQHWLSEPGYFPTVPVQARVAALIDAMQQVSYRVWWEGLPVESHWDFSAPPTSTIFGAYFLSSPRQITMIFYTPEPSMAAGPSTGWVEDAGAVGTFWDGNSTEAGASLTRIHGIKQE
jgi:hypothetical protein